MTASAQIVERRAKIQNRIALFPDMPAMCRKVFTHFEDPDTDFGVLAEEMRYDPGMTANVLKLANSAAFSAGEPLDSLRTAFVRLGRKRLSQVIIAQGVAGLLRSTLNGYNLRPSEFLQHSVWTAIASEELAKTLDIDDSEMLFTAGLLHDIGKVVLSEFIEQSADDFYRLIEEGNQPFDQIELSVLGFTHAQAGALIMENWRFPNELIQASLCHHSPQNGNTDRIVHIADMLAYSEGIGTGIDGLKYNISRQAVFELRIKPGTLEKVASRTLEKMQELERLLI